MTDQAFVTLATSDGYAKGALVLGRSLRDHHTTRNLAVLLGPHVSEPFREALRRTFDEVRLVDVMDSGDSAHLALMKRPDLGVTFTKLHCWTLTHYSKCVFMDADTMVLSNVDELFDREELSAAPDPGWPDCFNSGVFVFHPSNETYGKLLQYCTEHGSFDGAGGIKLLGSLTPVGLFWTWWSSTVTNLSKNVAIAISGDQGVLNSFFSNWATADISKHLPFIYNLSSIAIYSYLPAFKQYGSNAKVAHFLGKTKPWSYMYDTKGKRVVGAVQESSTHPSFLLKWWDIYSSTVAPLLVKLHGDQQFHSGCVMGEVEAGVRHLDISQEEPAPISSEERKQRWEQGQADYLGEDSFDNIQKKLDSFLK